jgi:hypothetical protein
MPTTVTSTIKSSGGDYTSLSAWETAKQADLVAADQIQQAECYNFALSDNILIDGWTTSATQYIRIYTPTAERHNGTQREVSGSGFRISTGGGSAPIAINENYVRIEGLEIENTSTTVTGAISIDGTALTDGANNIWVTECIIVNNSTNTSQSCVSFGVVRADILFRNNIVIVRGGSRGMHCPASSGSIEVTNCTIYNTAGSASLGILYQTGANIRNTFVGNFGTECFFHEAGSPIGEYNASTDASADEPFTTGALTNVTATACFTNLVSGSLNFTLLAGCQLIDAGVTATGVSTDIIGNTRS